MHMRRLRRATALLLAALLALSLFACSSSSNNTGGSTTGQNDSGQTDDSQGADAGTVEFSAISRGPQGRQVQREHSRFVREDGAWLYVDGQQGTPRA